MSNGNTLAVRYFKHVLLCGRRRLSAAPRHNCDRGNIVLAQIWQLTCQLWLPYFLIRIWCETEESWWFFFPSRSDMSFACSALSCSVSLCSSRNHALRESKGWTTCAKRYLQSFHLPNVFHTASCLHEVINNTKDRDAELTYLIATGIMKTATEITLLRHSLIENKWRLPHIQHTRHLFQLINFDMPGC